MNKTKFAALIYLLMTNGVSVGKIGYIISKIDSVKFEDKFFSDYAFRVAGKFFEPTDLFTKEEIDELEKEAIAIGEIK